MPSSTVKKSPSSSSSSSSPASSSSGSAPPKASASASATKASPSATNSASLAASSGVTSHAGSSDSSSGPSRASTAFSAPIAASRSSSGAGPFDEPAPRLFDKPAPPPAPAPGFHERPSKPGRLMRSNRSIAGKDVTAMDARGGHAAATRETNVGSVPSSSLATGSFAAAGVKPFASEVTLGVAFSFDSRRRRRSAKNLWTPSPPPRGVEPPTIARRSSSPADRGGRRPDSDDTCEACATACRIAVSITRS
mmetsp:Transcript_12745/g.54725  ORF Transcript_12745/g.54725 Transcript_12745/m.54725 type:complete len:251 (-) Transcript_12745:581-1333(-)